jgi:hypothetical protein
MKNIDELAFAAKKNDLYLETDFLSSFASWVPVKSGMSGIELTNYIVRDYEDFDYNSHCVYYENNVPIFAAGSVNHLVLAVYQESEGRIAYWVSKRRIKEKYFPDWNESEWEISLQYLVGDDIIRTQSSTAEDGFLMCVTFEGILRIQSRFSTLDGCLFIVPPASPTSEWLPPGMLVDDSGLPLVPTPPEGIPVREGRDGPPTAVRIRYTHSRSGGTQDQFTASSAAWTGVENAPISEQRLELLRQNILELWAHAKSLKIENNVEKLKLESLCSALVDLSNSPDPNLQAMREILKDPIMNLLIGNVLNIITSLVFLSLS